MGSDKDEQLKNWVKKQSPTAAGPTPQILYQVPGRYLYTFLHCSSTTEDRGRKKVRHCESGHQIDVCLRTVGAHCLLYVPYHVESMRLPISLRGGRLPLVLTGPPPTPFDTLLHGGRD